ncbi:MAG: pentapeptide repeat-containing protein [Phycisphaeraceae bacterium]|nr:pentapeptide repeat-containing protein [Phycisphaeraceae bacterium]
MAATGRQTWWGDAHRPFVEAWVADNDPRHAAVRPPTLTELADAIVRGASLAHAIVPDLRVLIEAVQKHSKATLPPPGDEQDDAAIERTRVAIVGGEIAAANLEGLDIRVTLEARCRFTGRASFGGAAFAGRASFGGAAFAGDASFGGAAFAGDARFDEARFTSTVFGDLRTATLREASAARRPPRRWFSPLKWLRVDDVSWALVRNLGGLAILNRVSIAALILVPALSSGYVAAQKLAARGEDLSSWLDWVVRIIGNDPHLSPTLALIFFAAVSVTLGLLVYQVFAPDDVKKRDEDEHLRDVEARYPEGSAQRNDGLRRALERLEDQARRRFDRHESFVRHHGDTIWLPPRDKIEWFDDKTRPSGSTLRDTAKATIKRAREAAGLPVDEEALKQAMEPLTIKDPHEREGFVPGAERARICLEEGARAEYWLRSHEKIAWAWASLLLYSLGVAFLLAVLVVQCRSVARAAGWLGDSPTPTTLAPTPADDPPPSLSPSASLPHPPRLRATT